MLRASGLGGDIPAGEGEPSRIRTTTLGRNSGCDGELVTLRGTNQGNSLAVQWLGLQASTAGNTGSVPGWGTKIPHAMWQPKTEKEKKKRGTNQISKHIMAKGNRFPFLREGIYTYGKAENQNDPSGIGLELEVKE